MPDFHTAQLNDLTSRRPFDLAQTRAYAYLDGIDGRPVFPTKAALGDLARFDEALPQTGAPAEEVVRLLDTYGSPATVAQMGGRYFGFVNGGALPAPLAAKWLSTVWDQNAALDMMSPVIGQLERVCEHWMVELLGLPPETAAGFVSGSATANLCALAAGRNTVLARAGWDVQAEGLFGAPPLRVIVPDQAHATIYKALGLLGLGRARVERVPTDPQGRMQVDQLPVLDGRCLLIAQAGNVNSGAFDDLVTLGERTRAAGAWLHVDGAFGLWAAAAPATRALTGGIELADSWAVDAHKTLNAPYDSGIVLCRDRQALVSALQTTAAYMVDSDQRDGMHYSLDMSRRGRAVELWATLKSLGREGVAALITQLCARATRFADRLRAAGFYILNDVVFSQVLVACDDPAETRATLAQVQGEGTCWCGGTSWHGQPAIRLSVCSWRTTDEDVDRSVAAFVAARAHVRQGRHP